MMRPIVNITMLIILLCTAMVLHAKEVGIFGETYPIIEEDFLQFIQKRVKTMQENGEWDKVQHRMQNRVRAHADRPNAVEAITRTTVKKQWSIDPSLKLSDDLKDHQGRIFAKGGAMFNPLTMVSLKNALVFIDADDEDQMQWAKHQNALLHDKTKIILVNGSIASTEKIFHQKIYFDQQGKLTQHFHIEHVPAVVAQDGMVLKVSEEIAS